MDWKEIIGKIFQADGHIKVSRYQRPYMQKAVFKASIEWRLARLGMKAHRLTRGTAGAATGVISLLN